MGSRKAFDFIQHDILINKLGRSGPDHAAVRWKSPPPIPPQKGFAASGNLYVLLGPAPPSWRSWWVATRNTFENQIVCQSGDEGMSLQVVEPDPRKRKMKSTCSIKTLGHQKERKGKVEMTPPSPFQDMWNSKLLECWQGLPHFAEGGQPERGSNVLRATELLCFRTETRTIHQYSFYFKPSLLRF